MINKKHLSSFSLYAVTASLTVFFLVIILRLWQADFRIPFLYAGDGMISALTIKGLIENGWVSYNSLLGAPFGSSLSDFPFSADSLHLLIIRLIAIFTSNYALVMNSYYILTFVIIALVSVVVMRKMGIDYEIVIPISILYAFLPYHFLRGEAHYYLSAYYMVPIIVLIAYWLNTEKEYILYRKSNGERQIGFLFNKVTYISLFVCFVVGCAGVYYAFFGCFFIVLMGIVSLAKYKDIVKLLTAFILTAFITIGLLVSLSPTIFYHIEFGDNPEVAQRSPVEAEFYGLKINQLVLPISNHRVDVIAEKRALYDEHALLTNENSSSLGMVGSLGFLLLIVIAFLPRLFKNEVLPTLIPLNLGAILLATIGGFGSIFAMLISPSIRCYNRISVYIAFFALLAVAVVLNEIKKRNIKNKLSRGLFALFMLVLLVVGIWDQTSPAYVPNYEVVKNAYMNDADFVSTIETVTHKNAMIFQLPYVPFPENPPVNRMGDYELLRGYFHSDNLRWSYGAMKGRYGDLWLRDVTNKPTEEMIKTLCFAGFSGIYIDRFGYEDDGYSIQNELSSILSQSPLEDNSERLMFFNLNNYYKELKAEYTHDEWVEQQNEALYPILYTWSGGFSSLEGNPEANWRWCSNSGQLRIINKSSKERQVSLRMGISTGYTEQAKLSIKSDILNEVLVVNSIETEYIKNLTIPPGNHVIEFLCDARRVDAPSDPRYLVFRINNFRIDEI
jgi:phosphoglycerol transferase